jgi:hypothetical protein
MGDIEWKPLSFGGQHLLQLIHRNPGFDRDCHVSGRIFHHPI